MRVFSALARGIKAAFRAVLNTLRSVNADAVHDFMASARVGSVDVTVHAGATLTPRGALRVAVNVVAESSIVQNVTALASKAMPAFNPL